MELQAQSEPAEPEIDAPRRSAEVLRVGEAETSAWPDGFLLSVVMPVYNELATFELILERVLAVDIPKEIIIIDDCSTDGTLELLRAVDGRQGIRVLFHEINRGKGAALQTGFSNVRGSHVIVQDADLEYDPEDYPALVGPILKGSADVVYGTRFHGTRDGFITAHYFGNRFLTMLTNLLYGCRLTDMETCYKCFGRELLDRIQLRSERFNIEPEITARIMKQGLRVVEVPISYNARKFDDGKKITWRDGFSAIYTLLKYRFVD